MVVKTISLAVQKNRGGILLYCAGAGGNTCGRKSRGDEKQLINLEWPYRQPVRIIGTPIFFHNGECAIYRHLGLLEPFTAALLARKL